MVKMLMNIHSQLVLIITTANFIGSLDVHRQEIYPSALHLTMMVQKCLCQATQEMMLMNIL